MFTRIYPASRDNSSTVLDLSGSGLAHSNGAEQVISLLQNTTRTLNLNHNNLSDEGSLYLIERLLVHNHDRSLLGLRTLSLNGNGITGIGLKGICVYLRANLSLTSLSVSNNSLELGIDEAKDFALTLSASNLQHLNLNGNVALSDTFISNFFPSLASPNLTHLEISIINFTALSVPSLIAYITDPSRVHRLRHLKCNGNTIGTAALRSLVRAIRDGANFTLEELELYGMAGNAETDAVQQGNVEPALRTIADLRQTVATVQDRNRFLRTATAQEARALLTAARVLLSPLKSTDSSPPWQRLPNELRIHILAGISPTLSKTQRLAVINYAIDWSTLPLLNFSLQPSRQSWSNGYTTRNDRESMLDQFLRHVECDHFQADGHLPAIDHTR